MTRQAGELAVDLDLRADAPVAGEVRDARRRTTESEAAGARAHRDREIASLLEDAQDDPKGYVTAWEVRGGGE